MGCASLTVGSEPGADSLSQTKRFDEHGQSYAINSGPRLFKDVGSPASYVNANFGKQTFANSQPIPPPPSFNYPLPKDSQERADELCKRGRAGWMTRRPLLSGSPMTRPTFSRNLPPERSAGDLRRRTNLFRWKTLENNIQPRAIESVSLAWLSTHPQCRLTIAG